MQRGLRIAGFMAFVLLVNTAGLAGSLVWDFGSSEGSASCLASGLSNLAVSDLERGNNLGDHLLLNTISPSKPKDYPGASGTFNASATGRIGALDTGTDGSVYFEITLTPEQGYVMTITSMSLGSRSTSTGPQALCVRSSSNNFTTDLVQETLLNDSNWYYKTLDFNDALAELETGVVLRIYGYNGEGKVSSNSGNWRIDDLSLEMMVEEAGALQPPVALAGSNIASDSFTARWLPVDEATGYLLDVYHIAITGAVAGTSILAENFEGFIAGKPNSGAHTIDISSRLNEFTTLTGWSGDKVYQAGGTVKLGTTSVKGWLKTPPLDLSPNSGVFDISLSACAWKDDTGSIEVSQITGIETNLLGSINNLNNDESYIFAPYTLACSGGIADSHLLFAASKSSNARFFIDDLEVTWGSKPGTPATNFVCESFATSALFTNLVDLIPGVYCYRVRAMDGERISVFSNLIVVDTTLEPQPPLIIPPGVQTVHVGDSLSLMVEIVPTDGDPVLETLATAQSEVKGVWDFSDSIFTYTPILEDIGERIFNLSASDKDGWSTPVELKVMVKPAQLPAIVVSSVAGCYQQDFNTLAVTGSGHEWDNLAQPLPGWSAFLGDTPASVYRTGSGTGTTGGIYAWGSSSTNRSLGSLASDSTKDICYGIAFTNAQTLAITNLGVSFVAEQWRMANEAEQMLGFEYSISDELQPFLQGEWRRVRVLSFVSPMVINTSQPSASAVYAAQKLSATLPEPIPAGSVLMLRWLDENDKGSNHGLGIDDLAVVWQAGLEPSGIPVGRRGVAEDFSGMQGSPNEKLPWMWRLHLAETPCCSGSYYEAECGVLLSNIKSHPATPGSYVFTATSQFDRAVGGLPGNGVATITLAARFVNHVGRGIRSWEVGYQAGKYRLGTTSTQVQLLFSHDGILWQTAGAPLLFAADQETAPCDTLPHTPTVVAQTVRSELSVPVGGCFYIAWQVSSVGEATPDTMQAVGISQITLQPKIPDATCLMLR